ncbi:MAG: hypothetical protein QNJ09_16150 [Paracoccaceae bacterium]|nr:hypothetical protein [Paracoccaceae bacterium]
MTEAPQPIQGGAESAAAEYVLGLLPASERVAFEAALSGDAILQQDVVTWAEYFATLTDPIPEVAPPPQVLRRIEVQIFGAKRAPWWRQVLPYLVGAVAAAGIAWLTLTSGLLTAPASDLRAALTAQEGDLVLRARFSSASSTLTLTPEAEGVPPDNPLQLWLIAGADAPPVSLGLLPPSDGTTLTLPPLLAESLPGAMLAVSTAPDGATTAAPVGPFRATGQLTPVETN